jgi:probable addiction module antidote protein
MPIKTIAFEPDQYFSSLATQTHLLEDAMSSGNTAYIADAIGVVARQRGIAEIAEHTGLNRQSLYAALSAEGNPTLNTVLKVLDALDLELTVRIKQAA